MEEAEAGPTRWKTLQLDDILVTVRISQAAQDVRWSVPPFHEKVRTTPLSRWLLKKGGQQMIRKVHLAVCPSLPSVWYPSDKMHQPPYKRKAEELESGGSRFVMATCSWILLYLLAANHVRKRTQQSQADETVFRLSYQMLKTLVNLGAKHCPDTWRVFRTHYGPARLEKNGEIACDGDGSWVLAGPDEARGIAGTLWQWVHPGHRPRGRIAQSILPQLIFRSCVGLARWALTEEEPSTSMLVALQRPGKKTHPALLSRLLQKQKKRRTVADWREDGLKVKTVVGCVEANASAHFVHSIRHEFKPCKVIELVLDSTRFATRDTQVCIAFAPEVGLAAYLPPIVNRQLKWREGQAGSAVTDAEWKQFCKMGFKAKHRMEVLDSIRGICHSLSTGVGKCLTSFRLPPGDLCPLTEGSARYWHPHQARWMRANRADLQLMVASASGYLGKPECPDAARDPPMLLLTVDQKQSQWTAAHFMVDPNGMGLMMMFRGDKFHRSWRDFVLAMKHSTGYQERPSLNTAPLLNATLHPAPPPAATPTTG